MFTFSFIISAYPLMIIVMKIYTFFQMVAVWLQNQMRMFEENLMYCKFLKCETNIFHLVSNGEKQIRKNKRKKIFIVPWESIKVVGCLRIFSVANRLLWLIYKKLWIFIPKNHVLILCYDFFHQLCFEIFLICQLKRKRIIWKIMFSRESSFFELKIYS